MLIVILIFLKEFEVLTLYSKYKNASNLRILRQAGLYRILSSYNAGTLLFGTALFWFGLRVV
jgi:hypothetical protein